MKRRVFLRQIGSGTGAAVALRVAGVSGAVGGVSAVSTVGSLTSAVSASAGAWAIELAAWGTVVVVVQGNAQAGVAAGFATEWTQILNKIQLVQGYIRQGQELRQKILMVLDMAKNTLRLPFQIFGPILAEIGSLHTVVREGRALAYSMANLDSEFRNRFKGYGFRASQFYNEYRDWSQTTLDTTLGTLKAANMQASQMTAEEGVLRQLRTMSQSSEGRLQAVQVGLQLSEQINQQLMKLRQIMLADIQSKQAYQASEMQKGSNQAAAEERLFTPGPARTGSPRFLGGNN